MEIITVTKENFEQEVLQAELPVLIDFWADWCGPCKMFSPIVDAFAKANEGRVKVGKVNVDEQQELAARFGIMSIPTAMLFKGGEAVTQLVGVQPQSALDALLG